MQSIIDVLSDKLDKNPTMLDDIYSKYPMNEIPYSSADLRCSTFKISPVDINAFPAGFNNFLPQTTAKLPQLITSVLMKNDVNKVLIIAENHTRNIKYLLNVLSLQEIFLKAGIETVVSNLYADEIFTSQLENNKSLVIHPLEKNNTYLCTKTGFKPDMILLNNDLTTGIPPILQNISQPIFPDPSLGWHNRKKSTSLSIYNEIASHFASILKIDPWLITSFVESASDLNFKSRESLKPLAEKVSLVLQKTKDKYTEYGIELEPYVFIKANNGTYGMGITTVKSPDSVMSFNKDIRKKMHKVKSQTIVSDVVIQEGVYSTDSFQGATSEPVPYTLCGSYFGTFLRHHSEESESSSLNKSGAMFSDVSDILTPAEKSTYKFLSSLTNISLATELSYAKKEHS